MSTSLFRTEQAALAALIIAAIFIAVILIGGLYLFCSHWHFSSTFRRHRQTASEQTIGSFGSCQPVICR
jgi:hypothetical protein